MKSPYDTRTLLSPPALLHTALFPSGIFFNSRSLTIQAIQCYCSYCAFLLGKPVNASMWPQAVSEPQPLDQHDMMNDNISLMLWQHLEILPVELQDAASEKDTCDAGLCSFHCISCCSGQKCTGDKKKWTAISERDPNRGWIWITAEFWIYMEFKPWLKVRGILTSLFTSKNKGLKRMKKKWIIEMTKKLLCNILNAGTMESRCFFNQIFFQLY